MPIGAIPRDPKGLNDDIILTVIREPYKEITAYFLRNCNIILLFVNSNLTIQEQAKAIKIIKKEISECPTISMGLIDKDWNYKCHDVPCQNKCNGVCLRNKQTDPLAF